MVIGAVVSGFELVDLDGMTHRLADYTGEIVVLDFWSAECPWSSHYDGWLSQHASGWARQGIRLLAIASNVNESVVYIRETVAERNIAFPVLLDDGCAVADLFGALTTPHIFVIDPAGRLAYQGAIDDRSFRQREASVNYLEQALAALLAGGQPDPTQTDPYGCTIVRPVAEQGITA
ncbi:MAG: redoxin domain-containing protein [Anaerolineae bacterium]|nr:redoxin domain-containing protein [Anaerolineae bacterium]